MHLWVGDTHYAGPVADFLILIAAVQLVYIRTDSSIINLTLDLRWKVALGGVSVLLSVGLAVLGTSLWGIVGLVAGLIVGRFVLSVAYPLLVGSALLITPKIKFSTLIRPGLVMGVTFFSSIYLGQRILAGQWITFITYSGMTGLIALVIGFFGGLTKEQQKNLVQRFEKIRLFARE